MAGTPMISKGERMKRVPGTRSGPLTVASAYTLLLGGATGISVALDGLRREQVVIFGILIAWLIRAATVGLFVGAHSMKIRGWFRTVLLPVESVERMDVRGYSGLMNRFTAGGLDPFHLFLRMFVFTIKDGVEREFPSTVSTSRQTQKALRAVVDRFPQLNTDPGALLRSSSPGRHASPRSRHQTSDPPS
ncbi:hypothetical protein [Curtobacterium sp. VKM Ac-2922]|uniref:hypothetical protein n=1 Tax=Curtobacterium sp. VKM Ac-2922 TaxID=2929475 RepID=UPI001FB34B14|nr:hypothetical protein [Curtobacterium sp. VKM Ac-2922]MCJ1715165.1 hypothetical protein [Curtobacterium sp. VKM Ac-2922]